LAARGQAAVTLPPFSKLREPPAEKLIERARRLFHGFDFIV
jgi:hypothetical protein